MKKRGRPPLAVSNYPFTCYINPEIRDTFETFMLPDETYGETLSRLVEFCDLYRRQTQKFAFAQHAKDLREKFLEEEEKLANI